MNEKKAKGEGGTRFIDARRRGFLQGAVLAGGAAASGATLADAGVERAEPGPEGPADASGYRLTEHVREYYAKARF